jgi:hypothetical protein
MSIPASAFGDSRTRVLLAVLAGYRGYVALTRATGLSRQPLWCHLHALRDDGLVGFEPHTVGTLRPLVRPISGSN